jgi:hypothetical protein
MAGRVDVAAWPPWLDGVAVARGQTQPPWLDGVAVARGQTQPPWLDGVAVARGQTQPWPTADWAGPRSSGG